MMRGRRVFRAIVWMVLACAASLAAEQHRNRLTGQKPKARVLHPAPGPAPAVPAVFTAAIRANNIGLALMDRHEFTQALGRFQTACVMNPASDTGCLNMGIALLHMGRLSEAHDILGKSAQRDPNNPRAWFNLGLVERAAGNDRVAVENFEKAAALDPNDPAIHYAIGEYYLNAQQYQQAISSFRKALDLDPFNLPSEFGLAQAELRTGDINGSLEHLRHAEHLTETGLGRPASDDYGEQGQYSFVQEMLAPPQPASPPIPVHFINVTEASGLPWRMALPKIPPRARGRRAKAGPQGAELQGPVALPKFLGSGACAFDYNNDGLPDLFLADADGTGHSALYRNAGHGRFVDATKSAKLVVSGAALGCATGDYDNDGYIDLAVSLAEGVQLFHNNGDGTFSDITDSARLNARGLVLGLAFADYNGDGNLDLLATRFANFPLADASQPFSFPADAHGPGNVLWRGSGRDQFTDETKQAALAGTAPSVGALACDVNNDGAIDFVVTGWAVSPTIYLNQREGAFRAVMPWATEMPGPAAGGVGLDFDHDGWMDLAFTHWSSPGLTLWRNVGGKWFERVRLPGPLWMRGWGIAAVDYDHDGWVDLVAVGEDFSGTGRIILLRNQGGDGHGGFAGFRDVTRETGLDKIVLQNPRGVVAFDLEGGGSTDFLITQSGGPPVLLKGIGSNKNHSLELALAGTVDNRDGAGAKVQIYSGAQQQTFQIISSSGYLGGPPPVISAGLGDYNGADVVRVVWPGGIVQDEIDVLAGKRRTITEASRGPRMR